MEADAWAWKGVSSLILLMFPIEDPESIADLFRIEGVESGLSWMLKRKGDGFSNKKRHDPVPENPALSCPLKGVQSPGIFETG